jgi:hypothetical protein
MSAVVEMGDNKNPAAEATVVAVATSAGAPMDVAAFSNLATGKFYFHYNSFRPTPPFPPHSAKRHSKNT